LPRVSADLTGFLGSLSYSKEFGAPHDNMLVNPLRCLPTLPLPPETSCMLFAKARCCSTVMPPLCADEAGPIPETIEPGISASKHTPVQTTPTAAAATTHRMARGSLSVGASRVLPTVWGCQLYVCMCALYSLRACNTVQRSCVIYKKKHFQFFPYCAGMSSL